MSKNSPKSLFEVISEPDSAVGSLLKASARRLQLADQLRAALPDALAAHLAACNLRDDGTLIVLTTGPEWAARLRFEAGALLAVCRESHPATTRVQIRVSRSSEKDRLPSPAGRRGG